MRSLWSFLRQKSFGSLSFYKSFKSAVCNHGYWHFCKFLSYFLDPKGSKFCFSSSEVLAYAQSTCLIYSVKYFFFHQIEFGLKQTKSPGFGSSLLLKAFSCVLSAIKLIDVIVINPPQRQKAQLKIELLKSSGCIIPFFFCLYFPLVAMAVSKLRFKLL